MLGNKNWNCGKMSLSPLIQELLVDYDRQYSDLLTMKEILCPEEFKNVYDAAMSSLLIAREQIQMLSDQSIACSLAANERDSIEPHLTFDSLEFPSSFMSDSELTPVYKKRVAAPASNRKGKMKLCVPDSHAGDDNYDDDDDDVVEVVTLDVYRENMGQSGPVFHQTIQQKGPECLICFEEVRVEDGVKASTSKNARSLLQGSFMFPGCKHVYCINCFQNWIKSVVRSSSQRFPLVCCVEDCSCTLEPSCKKVKDALAGSKGLLDSLLEKHLVVTGRAMFCPNRDCSKVIKLETGAWGLQSCLACGFFICVTCRVASHAPMTCEQFQSLPLADRKPEDIALFRIAKEKNWVTCPKCSIVVEKKDGCNFVRCVCGEGFCYKCGIPYKSLVGTQVNVHGTPGCLCLLFDVPAEVNAPPPQPRVPAAAVPVRRQAPVRQQANYPPDECEFQNGFRVAPYEDKGFLYRYEYRPHSLPGWYNAFMASNTCMYCDRRFGSKEDMSRHIRTTLQHPVYMCCDRLFKDVQGVRKHRTMVHGFDYN